MPTVLSLGSLNSSENPIGLKPRHPRMDKQVGCEEVTLQDLLQQSTNSLDDEPSHHLDVDADFGTEFLSEHALQKALGQLWTRPGPKCPTTPITTSSSHGGGGPSNSISNATDHSSIPTSPTSIDECGNDYTCFPALVGYSRSVKFIEPSEGLVSTEQKPRPLRLRQSDEKHVSTIEDTVSDWASGSTDDTILSLSHAALRRKSSSFSNHSVPSSLPNQPQTNQESNDDAEDGVLRSIIEEPGEATRIVMPTGAIRRRANSCPEDSEVMGLPVKPIHAKSHFSYPAPPPPPPPRRLSSLRCALD